MVLLPSGLDAVLRQVLPPLVTAYVAFVAMVVVARRRPVPRRPAAERHGRPHLAEMVRAVVGGYAVFLAIVLIFHVWLARERDALWSAVSGGAFLAGIALLMAIGSSLISGRGRPHA